MKCENCGAEASGNRCEYCGSELTQESVNMNITNNYYGSESQQAHTASDSNSGICPKCGNSRITFKRERIGTVTQSRSRRNYVGTGRQGQSVSQTAYRTIGVCQNCGHTWEPNVTNKTTSSGNRTWLWVLGWIFIFPLPLTVLLIRKKDMKPAVKYGIIAVAWVLFLVIGVSGNNKSDNSQDDAQSHIETVQTDNVADGTASENNDTTETNASETTESLDVVLGNFITEVVGKYNSQATEQLVFVEDFTPSDKESGHYRTEFRLTAYEDAEGKSYLLEDKVVDIIASKTIFGEINCRVYTNDTSIDQVISLIQGISPILDETLTDEDLQATIEKISSDKEANGYYYGELGLLLLGNDTKGYELMIKTD